MAINRGVLGTQTGSMGNITGSIWKGRNVYKQKVPARNASATDAQINQREKFRLLSAYSRLFGPGIRVGFKLAAATITEQNVFMSVNKDQVVGEDGDYTVLDLNLIVSSGSVGTVGPVSSASYITGGRLAINWPTEADGVSSLPSDQVNVIIYDPVFKRAYVGINVATRSAGSVNLNPTGIAAVNLSSFIYYTFAKRANSTATSASLAVDLP